MYLLKQMEFFFATWVKKDDGLEGRVLVVVDLNVLERLHQLVQHSVGYPADLRLGTVPVDHTAVACRHQGCHSSWGKATECVSRCTLVSKCKETGSALK